MITRLFNEHSHIQKVKNLPCSTVVDSAQGAYGALLTFKTSIGTWKLPDIPFAEKFGLLVTLIDQLAIEKKTCMEWKLSFDGLVIELKGTKALKLKEWRKERDKLSKRLRESSLVTPLAKAIADYLYHNATCPPEQQVTARGITVFPDSVDRTFFLSPLLFMYSVIEGVPDTHWHIELRKRFDFFFARRSSQWWNRLSLP